MASVAPKSGEVGQSFDVVIVGAGISGLYMLYRARLLGLSVRVYEAGSGVGGTWYWNRYPGARCDVDSFEYSFSFSNELQQAWRWRERYAIQPDILNYLNHVADRFELRPDIQFDTRVTSLIYDETTGRWTVRTEPGDVVCARFCIMASGNLSVPKAPEIKGLECFKGRWYQSSVWPEDGVDFTDQNVALVGTGSSGMQMAPQIARQAKHLYVFQRTANFSVAAQNRPITDEYDREYKLTYPERRQRAKYSAYGGASVADATRYAIEDSPEEQKKRYEELWQGGGTPLFMSAYKDLMTNRDTNDIAAEFVRQKIRSTVKNPATAELLCPKDHPLGARRLCTDIQYFETFNRQNVSLLDAKSDPVEEITETGIRTRQGREYAVDSIAFAIGFDAISGALLSIDIRGEGGRSLKQQWADGPSAYLGLMLSGFPNLFVVTGPGSPAVKSNMFHSIEQHVEWIADCLGFLQANDLTHIEPDATAERQWIEHVAEVANRTLAPTVESWYMGTNIPGKPRVFTSYMAGVSTYRRKCEAVVANGYEGFVLSSFAGRVDTTAA